MKIPQSPVNTPWACIQRKEQPDGTIFGEEVLWNLYKGRKDTLIWNLFKFLSFLFTSIKHVFCQFLRHVRYEICSRLTIKTPAYVRLTIRLKIKIPLTSFWPLYC